MQNSMLWKIVALFTLAVALLAPNVSFAHCDTMDGPVVLAAKQALATGKVEVILPWVLQKDEGVIRHAFEQTLTVRKLSPQAKELADMYFFETVVRIHRADEGMPYTGLKPAGLDFGPAIPAADRALVSGSAVEVKKMITTTVDEGIGEHFAKAMAAKKTAETSVEAGREYVEAYVKFIHYVEGMYQTAKGAVEHHENEAPKTNHQHE